MPTLRYGIELETLVPDDSDLVIGCYHRGVQVPYLPQGWTAEYDSSIVSSNGGRSCEIVSPILQGEEGLRQVMYAAEVLRQHGHWVNASCGVHVHVGWSYNYGPRQLRRLVTIVAYAERALYAITGTRRRESGGYCCSVRGYDHYGAARRSMDRNRYHLLNIVNLWASSKRTVEFRVFSGSLNPVKLVGWIQVCLGLVERALDTKRLPPWYPAPVKDRARAGQLETQRLLAFLGWIKRNGHPQYGWVADVVPLETVIAEFRRLAKQYDSMQ